MKAVLQYILPQASKNWILQIISEMEAKYFNFKGASNFFQQHPTSILSKQWGGFVFQESLTQAQLAQVSSGELSVLESLQIQQTRNIKKSINLRKIYTKLQFSNTRFFYSHFFRTYVYYLTCFCSPPFLLHLPQISRHHRIKSGSR